MSDWRDYLGLRKVNGSWFFDGRTDLKWWQHRTNNKWLYRSGIAIMAVGFGHLIIALGFFSGHVPVP